MVERYRTSYSDVTQVNPSSLGISAMTARKRSIGLTVHALTELAPDLLVPGHCTGWRAQHTLAAALPDSWVQGGSGTQHHLTSVAGACIEDRAHLVS